MNLPMSSSPWAHRITPRHSSINSTPANELNYDGLTLPWRRLSLDLARRPSNYGLVRMAINYTPKIRVRMRR